MSLKIKTSVLYISVLFGFIWCNYFNQAMLFGVGGSIVMIVELTLILLIWSAPRVGIITRIKRRAYSNLLISMVLFFVLYIIVFAFGADANSKVTVPFIDITVPKQIYDAIFNLLFLLAIIMSAYKTNEYEKRQILNVFIFYITTVAAFSIIGVIQNPELIKSETYSEEGSVFTLGYSFAYVLAILFPIALFRFRQNKSKKWFWMLLMTLIVIAVYYSGYFIALTVIIIALLAQWILSIKNRAVMCLVLVIMLTIFLFLTFSNTLQDFLLWLAEKTTIEVFSGRLREIVDYMNNGMSTAEIGRTTYRFFIYKDTWDHFLQSPIWGNYIIGVFDGSYDHATMLDLLSCGGIILGGTFLLFLKKGYQFGCSYLENIESRRALLSCYVAYLYLALTNSVLSYRLLGILFTIAPLLLAEGEKIRR